MVKASMDAQESEEAAISEELKMATAKIDALAKDPDSQEPGQPLSNPRLPRAQKISPVLDAATEALKQQNLVDAVAREKEARDQMHRLSRLVGTMDKTESLQASAAELAWGR